MEYVNSLAWQSNPSNTDITGYRIYHKDEILQKWILLDAVDASTFQYWHRDVFAGQSYTYRVRAVHSSGKEGPPASISL